MSWIEQISEEDATGRLATVFNAARGRAGGVAHIIRVMSLRPDPLATFMRLYTQLMHEDATLSQADREMLATVTSEVNGCFY